ncbi:unnamed protein product, partial [Gongylonema pulchrum]|uniref:TIP120 domain-containing protein n=1 Tax=Gongylonema pulchrum TaxID=637853 RepID=A0A183DAY7_9BILA
MNVCKDLLACLQDQHDIKLLSYLMLARLSVLCPSQVLQRLDTLCEPLKAQIQAKLKDNAVKQENDKQDELRRAALRVVIAIQVSIFLARYASIHLEARCLRIIRLSCKGVFRYLGVFLNSLRV